MPLQDLLDQFSNAVLILVGSRAIPSNPGVIRRESALDLVRKNGQTVGGHVGVILDVLNEPPCQDH